MPHGYNAQNKEGQQCQSGQHGGGYNRTKKLTRRARLVGLSRSNSRWHLFSTATAMFSVAFLVTFLCSSILAPARNTNAETVTESSSASGYTLSLSATPVVNLNVGVLEVPVMTVGVGTVSTSTTAPGGYKLYLSMAGTSNDLRRTGSDGDTISATTGTMADSSALGIGEWGYAIPSTTPNISATDFDTSYDIMESAYPSSKGFAAPPISTATAELITSTNSPNTTANDISVYYGINADDTTPLGNYTGSVLWTALADSADTPSANVSPSSGATIGGETITVTTTLFTTSAVDAHIYMKQGASSTEMTCNRTSYTPLTYTCTTPEKPAGEYEIYVDIPRYEKTYTADFTYFVQPEFFRVSNMQDMTGLICTSATIPSASAQYEDTTGIHSGDTNYVPTMTLTDTRDNKSYIVRKLADGNCWMTSDLKILFTANQRLYSASTNVPDDSKVVSVPTRSTYVDDWNVANAWRSLTSNGYVYYSWYTATAGYGTDGGNVTTQYDICPRGWHLPKSGTGSQSYTQLGTAYNISNSGGATAYNKLISFPLNFAMAGDVNHNTSRIDATYFESAGWYFTNSGASTSNAVTVLFFGDSSHNYTIRLNGQDNMVRRAGASVRCVANTPLDDISNMQDMTNEICSNTLIGESKTLKDTRDNSTYTVKKLNDGRCWMTQNLRLKNYTLKASDSNVTSDGFVVPNAASGTSYDTSYVSDSGSTDYGVYYSWYAATAGAGTQSQTGDTSTSVCPKGWRLPKGGDSGEFQTLYNNYRGTSGTETSTNMRNTSGPNLKLSGIRISSTMYYVGELGYYWSSTGYLSDNSHAYILYLSSSAVTPAPNEYKQYGFTIRCINAN